MSVDEEMRWFGAVVDPVRRDFIRWTQIGEREQLYLAVADCYRFMGVKRVDVPRGSRIRSVVRGARTRSFWREHYERSGTEVILGVPAQHVRDLGTALAEEIALLNSGGVERLCYFLLKNCPVLLMETCFISPQKSVTRR